MEKPNSILYIMYKRVMGIYMMNARIIWLSVRIYFVGSFRLYKSTLHLQHTDANVHVINVTPLIRYVTISPGAISYMFYHNLMPNNDKNTSIHHFRMDFGARCMSMLKKKR